MVVSSVFVLALSLGLIKSRSAVLASGPVTTAAGAAAGPAWTALAAFAAAVTAAAAPAGPPTHAEVIGPARRARRRGSVLGIVDPSLSAGATDQLPRLHTVLAAADKDRLAGDESLGHLGPTALENAADRLA